MTASHKILVVDDERDVRIYVSTIVEALGHVPVAAENGTEALFRAEMDSPRLIILDIMMPGIEDGVHAYRRFRTDPQFNRIPIIVLSAIAKKTFLHAIRILEPQVGQPLPAPQGYVEKPPDAEELGRLITELVPAR